MDRNHMPVSHIARVSAHSLYANRLEVCMCMGKAYIYVCVYIYTHTYYLFCLIDIYLQYLHIQF